MRIIHEDPGCRLELAETESRAAPLAIGVGLTLVLATPWRWLWAAAVHGAGRDSLDPVPSAIWAAGGLFLVVSSFGGQRLETFCADRMKGRLEWRRSHVLGLLRWGGGVALDSLDGFTLVLGSSPGASSAKLRLALQPREGASERRFELSVDRLQGTEQIADFALRLGAAAGLAFHRVVLNEGGRFEIELRAQPGPGREAVPRFAGGTGAGGSERSPAAEAAAAAAAIERLPPFDPATLRGSARVGRWEPGREVRFDKGWGATTLLSPLLLCAPLGPWALFGLASMQTMPLLPKTAALLLLTFVGFGLALVGWAGLEAGLPRRVRLDWATRMLHVDTLTRSRAIPFADVSGLELRHKVYASPGRGGIVTRSFWSQLRAGASAPSGVADELLVETRSFRNDDLAPRRMVLPLARELASALRLELRETGPA